MLVVKNFSTFLWLTYSISSVRSVLLLLLLLLLEAA